MKRFRECAAGPESCHPKVGEQQLLNSKILDKSCRVRISQGIAKSEIIAFSGVRQRTDHPKHL